MNSTQPLHASGRPNLWRDTRGVTLPLSLMFLTAVGILGATAVLLITTDVLTGGNFKLSAQAFYVAEAGLQEARARLRANAGTHQISDIMPTDSTWKAFIGSSAKAQAKGYNASEHPRHVRVDSLYQNAAFPLDYTVVITHATDGAGNILYWGDPNGDGINTRNSTTGRNIYAITSYGFMNRANKILEIEAAPVPSLGLPAALYVEAPTGLLGNSVRINGIDSCGSDHKPAVATPLHVGTMSLPPVSRPDLYPAITGNGGGPTPPNIQYNSQNLNVESMVDFFKGYATHTPTPQTGNFTGGNWGTPQPGVTPQYPSACSETNIVYFNTGGSSLHLTNSTGCGLLLVEGDLRIDQGFSWYGVVLITGNIDFHGEIGQIQITGAVLSGEDIGTNNISHKTSLVYCSEAINAQTQNLPLLVFMWKEHFD